MRELQLAARNLWVNPLVSGIAVLSLALGIGANSAIYSLFEQILLRALPVARPDRLVNLSAPGPKPGSNSCNQAGDCEQVFSYPMFRDLEREQTVLAGLAAHRLFGANLALAGRSALSGEGLLVSGSYFPLLGLRPALGRLLGPSDDRTIGAHPVAVLSYGFWESRLGADPSLLGRPIVVNGHPLTIIGVAPRGFEGPTLGARPFVFVPLTMRGQMSPGFDGFADRRDYWAYLFGRLRPGGSIAPARAALNVHYRRILHQLEAPLQEGMSEQTMARFRAKRILLDQEPRGQSSVHGEARTPLLLLLATTAIVLLIACANIANLLLARGAQRAPEMAVRLSLGANRWRLLRQLLTESLLLAALGGAASLLVARWTLASIGSILPPEVSSTLDLGLRAPVVVFAALTALATGLLFGLFPALHSTRADLISTIRAGAGQHSGARSAARFRIALVTAQIALSMALLISAGLFLKSLVNLRQVDLGLQPENVIAFGLSPELNGYPPERSRALFAELERELAALPGVTGVAAGMVPILSGSSWGSDVAVEGFEKDADTDDHACFNEIGPNYFRTLGVALRAGREFTAADALGAPKVAVVNQAFAEKFKLGRQAVGKRMRVEGSDDGDALDIEIVGLVADAKYSEVRDQVPPLYYLPYRQDPTLGAITFYLRTAGAPEPLLRALPRVVARLDPNLPVEQLKTLPQHVRDSVFLDRMISMMSGAFAALATLLAVVGLYGLLAYTVAQRTREIGVRMALGADRARVRALVLGQVVRLLLVGGAIGIAAALGLGRVARGLLFGLESHDPAVIGLATLVLGAAAFGAGYLPAQRAARVDPIQALRCE